MPNCEAQTGSGVFLHCETGRNLHGYTGCSSNVLESPITSIDLFPLPCKKPPLHGLDTLGTCENLARVYCNLNVQIPTQPRNRSARPQRGGIQTCSLDQVISSGGWSPGEWAACPSMEGKSPQISCCHHVRTLRKADFCHLGRNFETNPAINFQPGKSATLFRVVYQLKLTKLCPLTMFSSEFI